MTPAEGSTMRRVLCASALAALVLVAGRPAQAHHAFTAEFDGNQPVSLKGTVTKAEWVNPHSWVYVDVKDESGKVTNWAIECGAPNALLRRGWNKNDLPIGTTIIVDGYRAKNGSPTANARDITLPDGRKLFVGSSGTGAPYEKK
jgi:hypothetical protein